MIKMPLSTYSIYLGILVDIGLLKLSYKKKKKKKKSRDINVHCMANRYTGIRPERLSRYKGVMK